MTLERYLWWMVLAWCWWRAWTANRKADAASRRPCDCNQEGSVILARLVLKIDDARRFIGDAPGWNVEATHRYRVRDRVFILTARELEPTDG